MYRVAIVDDEKEQSDLLTEYAARFSAETGIAVRTVVFNDSIDFVTDFKADFDIIFLDIKMPDMDGIDAARRLRAVDNNVPVIYVTNMAQYAIKGYEVSALDFVVKPINYFVFSQKLRRAIDFVDAHKGADLTLSYNDNYLRVRTDDVYYIEKDGNYIVFHTANGDFRTRGTMEQLALRMGRNFSRNLRGCLCNLAHVSRIDKSNVYVNEYALPLSRVYRRQFIEDLASYRSGT